MEVSVDVYALESAYLIDTDPLLDVQGVDGSIAPGYGCRLI
jgi:hypothetical protein